MKTKETKSTHIHFRITASKKLELLALARHQGTKVNHEVMEAVNDRLRAFGIMKCPKERKADNAKPNN